MEQSRVAGGFGRCLSFSESQLAIRALVALVGLSRSFEHVWPRMCESSGAGIAVVRMTFLTIFKMGL